MATIGSVEITEIEGLPLRRYEDAAGPVAVRRVSWGAVFGGTAIGAVFQVWLGMLGAAIGASTFDPLRNTMSPTSGAGIATFVWLGVSVLISAYVGGWATGKLAGIPRRMESALHGAMSWALSNIVMLLLIGTVFGGLVVGFSRPGSPAPAISTDTGVTAVLGTTWALVISMFLGLCAGIAGAIVGAPLYPKRRV